jgi:Kef-type K+ transport system membrane component KefB
VAWLAIGQPDTFGYALVPSLIIGVAMTATSVGISLAVWQHQKATDSGNRRLLLDIAELDDISAVILMAMLFTLIPLLVNGHPDQLWVVLSRTILVFVVKISAFVALWYYFATLAEHPIVEFFRKFDPPPLPMLTE